MARRTTWHLVGVLLAALVVAASCSGKGTTRHAARSTPSSSASSTAPVQPVNAAWPTYQHDGARTGTVAERVGPNLARRWQSPPLDGAVYAQPLLVGDTVIVATEGDSVYALDAASGAVRWRTNLGRPVPNSELPCGNIDPVGITGTPVVDPGSAGTLWVVAMVEPRRYVLVALAVRDGAEQHRVDVSVPGLDPRTHIQRGALTVLGGRVYVPFGGRFGDCGQYHGWVLGYPTSGTGAPAVYQVPTGREGGIWAPPGPTSAPDGTLLVATGNSDSTSRYDMGNSVVRLSADLRAVDSWAPRDWVSLNRTDTDIGSISPAVGPGGAVVQVGKSGVAYLLRGNRLGGIGGEVAKAQVCGRAFGGTAVSADAVYVSCDDGVVALRVTASSLTKLWSGPAVAAGPPAVSAGVVWSVDTGSGTLLGLDPGDGHVLSKLAIGRVTHFTGVAIGGGQVVVATTSTVSAWR